MTHETYSWQTFDGLRIFAQRWTPPAPRAVISLVHGIGDHSNRYPYFVQAFTEAGYAINAYDLRGHGQSEGPRVHSPSYEALLRDIGEHLDQTRARFPGLPVVVYGHSFGAAQVLCYGLQRRPGLNGVAAVVASSPGLASGVHQPGWKVMLGRVLAVVMPRVRLPLGCPVETLSTDKAWVARSLADPLFYDTLSARIGIEMLATNRWILEQREFPLPLLVMQGTADRYVDAGVNIAFAERLRGERRGRGGVTLKVWEGMGHELHNEVLRGEVMAFVRAWVDSLTARQT